jgi:hypothetical protein
LQAFIINVFGCLDNLAWIWVVERKILKTNGARLSPKEIGLRTPNVSVRESLPEGFRKYLESIADWFAYLESYRHALAHQIPLYIPPYAIDPRNEARYQEVEETITARVVRGELTEVEALKRERDGLTFFRPFIMHSVLSGPDPTAFHVQMLADFKTIEALSAMMLDELARPLA